MKKLIIILLLFNMLSATGQDPGESLLRTSAFLEQGKYSEAISEAGKGLDKGDDYRLFLMRGKAYLLSGQSVQARMDFESSNRLVPGSGEFGLARIYASEGNADLAVESLVRNMNSDFKISEKELLLDDYLVNIETSVPWKGFIKRNWYNQLEKGAASVEYYLGSDRIDEAENELARVESLYSEKPEIDFLRGSIEFAKGEYSQAVVSFGKAVENGLSGYNVFEKYIIALNRNGNYAAALKFINDSKKKWPGHPDLLLLESESLENSGSPDQAAVALRKYLDLFPADEQTLARIGRIAARNSDYSSALKYFSISIEKYPGNPAHFIDRGDVYLTTRSWTFADKDYSMALDLDPYNSQTWYNKGLALIEIGKKEDACHCFIQSKRLGNRKASALIGKYCIR